MKRFCTMEEIRPLIEESLQRGEGVTLTVTGRSMWPMLRGGRDSVTLHRPKGALKKYDIPLYRRRDGSWVLHRIVEVRTDGYLCMGDHQLRAERVARRQIVGVVTSFTRGGRTISPRSPACRFYVTLWCRLRLPRRVGLRLEAAYVRLRGRRG
ncbi:MAG: S24/S26 family peptidase [Clostridiales bacterium]|nr:S24/S26 family peptidase [Clostridiales bacterium]